MSILTLLEQDIEIRSRIRRKFQFLSLGEKLELILPMEQSHELAYVLRHSAYIPKGLNSELLNEVIPYAKRHEYYYLDFFKQEVLYKYAKLHPEFNTLNLTQLADVIVKDVGFLRNEPAAQILTYMLKHAIGSFCYDW